MLLIFSDTYFAIWHLKVPTVNGRRQNFCEVRGVTLNNKYDKRSFSARPCGPRFWSKTKGGRVPRAPLLDPTVILLFTLLSRSVVGVLGPSGDRVNRYSYDPFGRMLEVDEQLPQDFTFIGQWGVAADRELKDIYWMRFRHYDAQLGRFLSLDPLGINAIFVWLTRNVNVT